MAEFGRLDILVNNAAFQMAHQSLDEITDEEWERTFAINIHAQFYLVKAALPHLKPGSAIVNSSRATIARPICSGDWWTVVSGG